MSPLAVYRLGETENGEGRIFSLNFTPTKDDTNRLSDVLFIGEGVLVSSCCRVGGAA